MAYQQAWKEAEAALPKEQGMDQKARGVLEIRDKQLYRKGMLWVPEELVHKIVESEHDTKVAGHMGQDKTIKLIRQNFWWPKMNEHQEKKKLCPECPDALDTLDASDTTCLTRTQFTMAPCIWTQLATVPCVRTQLATASAYWTERVRAFSFWTQLCQGIFLLDTAVSGHFPSGRCRIGANGIWLTHVVAPRSRWQSRYGTSQQILLSHSQTRSGFQA